MSNVWVNRSEVDKHDIPADSIAKYLDYPGNLGDAIPPMRDLCLRRAMLPMPEVNPPDGIWSDQYIKAYKPAVDLLRKAKAIGREVLIWGDYDVDGMTATACLYKCLLACRFHVKWAIPVRTGQGYGIHVPTIRNQLTAPGVLITVDNGINNIKEIKDLKELGYWVVITDHHIPETEDEAASDYANVVINPKLYCKETEDEYMASGCFVASKLGIAVVKTYLDEAKQHNLHSFCATLTAFSIVSDSIPLNHQMIQQLRYGLAEINNTRHDGIRALLALCAARENQPITSQYLAFSVVPKLNAAGRMDKPEIGCQLLLLDVDSSSNCTDSLLLANQLKYLNADRKIIEQRIVDEAKVLIPDLREAYPNSLVVFKQDWHGGVLGIVAARLSEEYHIPVIVLTRKDQVLEGSGRVPEGFDLHGALTRCSHLLVRFGGHKAAAGMQLRPEQLDAFRKAFDETVSAMPHDEFVYEIDTTVHIVDLYDVEFQVFLSNFDPVGNGNPALILRIKDVEVLQVDTRGETKSLLIKDRDGFVISVSRFRAPEEYETYKNQRVDILVTPHPLYFSGTVYVEWKIVDVKVLENS